MINARLVATEYLPGKPRRSAALQNASEKPAQIIPSFIRPVSRTKVARASSLARLTRNRKPEACATSNHPELHSPSFVDHGLIPRRISDGLAAMRR